MKKNTLFLYLFLTLPMLLWGRQSHPVEGIWLGTLEIPNADLRLAIIVSGDDSGKLQARLNSIDQGGVEIPLDEASFADDTMEVRSAALGLHIKGVVDLEKESWTTIFKQGPAVVPLGFKRVDQLPGKVRPQEPHPPYPYRTEDVRYDNREAGISLAATLTIPPGEGPFPAVVLLTGSGPQNRDEEIMGHKPFKVLADHLSRKGILVLRSDDRGVGESQGDFSASTTGDFAGDGLAAIEYLLTRPEVDPGRTGLAGHSEGGMMAPLAATWSKDVDFLVLLAAPAIGFGDIILYQKERQWKKAGMSEEDMALNREWHHKVSTLVSSDMDKEALEEEIRKLYAGYSEEELGRMHKNAQSLEGEIKLLTSPWWRYANRYDAKAILKKVECPVLAINGEKDTQVTAPENLAAIEKALKQGLCPSYEIKSLPDLNHLFQTSQSGDEMEYGRLEESFSPVAMQIIADWILGL